MSEKRVLVVDDDETLLFLVKIFTEKLLPNHQIITVNSSAAALAELQHQPFDLILADYDMPQMNGLDLAHAIRQIYPDVPIILMTGNNYCYGVQPQNGTRPLSGFLAKPFSIMQLKQTLQQNGL